MATALQKNQQSENPNPASEYMFDVDLDGTAFRFQILTTVQEIEADNRARSLLGRPVDDSYGSQVAQIVAELEVALVAAPDGWSPRSSRNPKRMISLWEAYVKARDSFRESMEGF